MELTLPGWIFVLIGAAIGIVGLTLGTISASAIPPANDTSFAQSRLAKLLRILFVIGLPALVLGNAISCWISVIGIAYVPIVFGLSLRVRNHFASNCPD